MEQLLNVIFIKMSASFPYLALLSSMELKSQQWNEDSLSRSHNSYVWKMFLQQKWL